MYTSVQGLHSGMFPCLGPWTHHASLFLSLFLPLDFLLLVPPFLCPLSPPLTSHLLSSCPSLPVPLYPASFLPTSPLPWSILQLFCLDIKCISCWAKSSSTRVSSSSLRTSGSVLLSRSHLQTVRNTLGLTDGSAIVTKWRSAGTIANAFFRWVTASVWPSTVHILGVVFPELSARTSSFWSGVSGFPRYPALGDILRRLTIHSRPKLTEHLLACKMGESRACSEGSGLMSRNRTLMPSGGK